MDERILLKPEEAAQRLGVSRSVVYELMHEGRLESLAIGRSRRIEVRALQAFVERERKQQTGAIRGAATRGRRSMAVRAEEPHTVITERTTVSGRDESVADPRD